MTVLLSRHAADSSQIECLVNLGNEGLFAHPEPTVWKYNGTDTARQRLTDLKETFWVDEDGRLNIQTRYVRVLQIDFSTGPEWYSVPTNADGVDLYSYPRGVGYCYIDENWDSYQQRGWSDMACSCSPLGLAVAHHLTFSPAA